MRLKTIIALCLPVLIIGLAGCKKEEPAPTPQNPPPQTTGDTTAPVITLSVSNPMTQSLPAVAGAGTWTAPTATAMDDHDGDISAAVSISSNVDPNLSGVYSCTYSVSDSAGNMASVTLNVHIVNDAAYLAGYYSVVDSVYSPTSFVSTYMDSVIPSATVNNRVRVKKFGNFINSPAYFDVAGNAFTLPTQTYLCGTPPNTHTFSQTSPGTIAGGPPVILTIFYQDDVNSSTYLSKGRYVKQ